MFQYLNLDDGMYKFKLILYYLIIQKLLYLRLFFGFNIIRLWYIVKIFKVIFYDKNLKFENGIYIFDVKYLKIGKFVRINENVFL